MRDVSVPGRLALLFESLSNASCDKPMFAKAQASADLLCELSAYA
jgi:hypothetical protein